MEIFFPCPTDLSRRTNRFGELTFHCLPRAPPLAITFSLRASINFVKKFTPEKAAL